MGSRRVRTKEASRGTGKVDCPTSSAPHDGSGDDEPPSPEEEEANLEHAQGDESCPEPSEKPPRGAAKSINNSSTNWAGRTAKTLRNW